MKTRSLQPVIGKLPTGARVTDDKIAALAPAFLTRQLHTLRSFVSSSSVPDYVAIRRYGHNLRGTGTGYGYPELSELAKGLEKAAIAEHADEVGHCIDALEAALTGVV